MPNPTQRIVRGASLFLAVAVFAPAKPAWADVINGGFEDGGPGGQGVLPAPWYQASPGGSADLFDHLGLTGLDPDAFGFFTGVTAAEGTRWVGAAHRPTDGFVEAFGQDLGATLTAGATYSISALLHASSVDSPGFVETNDGEFRILLSTDGTVGSGVPVGALAGAADFGDGWTGRSFTFTAPADAASRPFFVVLPQVTAAPGRAWQFYQGIDAIQLREVPAPGALWLMVTLAAARRRRPS